MSDSLRDLRDIAPRPKPTPPGPIERPSPRMKKPPQPIRPRNEKRMAARNAESFGPQAAACRKRACAVPNCRNRPSVPHHTRSRGAGGGDESCAPVCWEHHSHVHDHGLSAFAERFGVDLEHEAAKLAAELAARAEHDCLALAVLREDVTKLRSEYVCSVCHYVIPGGDE